MQGYGPAKWQVTCLKLVLRQIKKWDVRNPGDRNLITEDWFKSMKAG